jgi:hypothetical protein
VIQAPILDRFWISGFLPSLVLLPGTLKSLYERHKDKRKRPLFDEISKALHSVAADYLKSFIIIDALNECQVSDGGRKQLLSEIFDL